MQSSDARVLVVGAGVVGCSLSYHLSNAGANVVLLDSGGGVSDASRASLGVLTHYSGGFSGYGIFIRDSLSLHRLLAEELFECTSIDVGWSRPGGIDLAFDQRTEIALEALYKDGKAYAVDVERLDAKQILAAEPSVSRDVRSGLYFPDDQRIDPMKLVCALLTASRIAGTVVHWGERLLNIEHCDEHGVRVLTSRARRSADVLVLASGAWTRDLADQLEARISVRPVRGQYACFSGPAPKCVLRHKGFQLISDKYGTRVGATTENVGFAPQSTRTGECSLSSVHGRVIAKSKDSRVLARGAGLRAKPKKGRPMIGPLKKYSSVFVATGHYKNGVLLAPLTGRVLANWILAGDPGRNMAPFAPER